MIKSRRQLTSKSYNVFCVSKVYFIIVKFNFSYVAFILSSTYPYTYTYEIYKYCMCYQLAFFGESQIIQDHNIDSVIDVSKQKPNWIFFCLNKCFFFLKLAQFTIFFVFLFLNHFNWIFLLFNYFIHIHTLTNINDGFIYKYQIMKQSRCFFLKYNVWYTTLLDFFGISSCIEYILWYIQPPRDTICVCMTYVCVSICVCAHVCISKRSYFMMIMLQNYLSCFSKVSSEVNTSPTALLQSY